MSLPPGSLAIKRHIDDDPVLYLHQKRLRSALVWQRLDSQQPLSEIPAVSSRQILNSDWDVAKPGPFPSRVPAVRSTRPGDENIDKQNGKPGLFQNVGDGSQRRDTGELRPGESQKLQRPMLPVQARQFRLLANSFLSPSHVKAGHGIQKQKKTGKNQVPVLTETQEASFLTSWTDPGQSSMPQDAPPSDPSSTPGAQPTLAQNLTPPLKRPSRTAAEMRWRAETWNTPRDSNKTVPQPEDSRQGAGDHLPVAQAQAMDLSRQLAFQDAPNRLQDATAVAARSDLKFLPKPPTPRSPRHSSRGETTHEVERLQCGSMRDGEYVIDIYAPLKDTHIEDIVRGMQPDRIGVIEIEDGDIETWQEYLEDVDDDKDWDSEDEDENAEEYHGNDYPEDELDSDDEFDREVYKHRNGASDDEEFDEDYDGRSDEKPGRDSR